MPTSLISARTDIRKDGPVVSASAMPIHSQCGASFARSLEAWRFYERHQIAPPGAGPAAFRGNIIHNLIASVPYGRGKDALRAYRVIDGAVQDKIGREEIDIDAPGRRFVVASIMLRNRLFDDLYRLVESHGPAKTLAVFADDQRIATTFDDGHGGSVRGVSGLLDSALVLEDSAGKVYCAVLDFKSGQSAPASRNAQIATNSVLLRRWLREEKQREVEMLLALVVDPSSARAALSREGKIQQTPGVVYREEALAALDRAISSRVQEVVSTAQALATAETAGGEIPASADQDVENVARAGSHCLFCNGKVCCQKVRQHLESTRLPTRVRTEYAAAHKAVTSYHPDSTAKKKPELTAARDAVLTAMKVSDLALAKLAVDERNEDAKLLDKLGAEIGEISRQLHARDLPVPGLVFEPGKIKYEIAADPGFPELPKQPNEVYNALLPLFPDQGRESFPFDVFQANCVQVNPVALQVALVEVLQLSDRKEVARVMEEKLGASNPVLAVPNRVSVTLDLDAVQKLREAQAAGPLEDVEVRTTALEEVPAEALARR